MSKPCYCINPRCNQPNHPSNNNPNVLYCQSCGSDLLLNGKYRVSRLLSDNSGFGTVYEVFEGFSAKILKVLLEEWNNQPKVIALFKQEYDVLYKLSRQGVIGVPKADAYFPYQTREGNEFYCLVMEKVEGIDLEKWLEQQQNEKMSQRRALKWLREVTLILDRIHGQNWFHRDLKPPNIMLRNSGELVLIDFGTAREETQTYYQKLRGQRITGIVSVGYTPNEQQHGQAVAQSDFFALGRTFVHLLTGKHPNDNKMYDAMNDVLHWREETENVDPLLLDFIDELMKRLPHDRPTNTKAILQRLDEIEKELKQKVNSPSFTTVPIVPPTVPISKSNHRTSPLANPVTFSRRNFLIALGLASGGAVILWQWLTSNNPTPSVNTTPNGDNTNNPPSTNISPPQDPDRKGDFTEQLPNGIELKMVAIPAGSFMIGLNDGGSDEKPVHQVTLNEFCIGKYPITQAQYQAVMGKNPSYFSNAKYAPLSKGSWGDFPVEKVSWNDAQEFCQKLSQMTGKKYQLPSESQWEYACRAGSTTKWYFGNDENQLKDYAWYIANSDSQTHAVGQKKPNDWGLYDMSGNVWEWCQDNYQNSYNNHPRDGTALKNSSNLCILRGGSWNGKPNSCRSAFRGNNARDRYVNRIGFRILCS